MHAIELDGLRMEYVNGRGIHGLTLQVERGEIFGFLGPNGAGKSTTIRTLLGMLTPDAGTARVAGRDIVADGVGVRRVTGYLPSENTLYLGMSGEEALIFSLRVRGCLERMSRGVELAKRLCVDLRPKLRSLSHGQRQKVAIVVALAHDPEVLILDEPTTGLDPLVQEEFFELLRGEREAGKTVFMSSHVLSEVEQLCKRVGIIRDGLLVEVNEVEALRHQRVKHVSVTFGGPAPDVAGWPGCSDLRLDGSRARFSFHGPIGALLERLAAAEVVDASVGDPSLDEVFRAFYRDDGEGQKGGGG
jgi:ABC-2 type transport system ATP-binding protein